MVDFSASNLLLAGLILFLAVSAIIKEQEDGILPVLRCTKKGRGTFFLHKSLAVWCLCAVLTGVFLLENLAVGACCMAVFYGIAPVSSLGIWHYANPVAMIKAAPLFREETYLNLFGNPVSPVTVVFAAVFIMAVLLVIGIVYFAKTEKSGKRIVLRKEKGRIRSYSGSIWGQEVYKLFVLQKGVWILLLLLMVQVWFYLADYRPPLEEVQERVYIRQLEGELGEKQRTFIEKEQLRIQQETQVLDREKQVFENRILTLYESLKEKQDAGEKAEFIIQSGYEKLFGISAKNQDALYVLMYAMALVFGCSMYMSMEKSGGMMQLIEPTKKGWNTVRRRKIWIAVGYALAGGVLVWGFEILWVVKTYGLSHLETPLNWLLEFRNQDSSIKIWMYLAMLIILRLAGGILTCLCILKISEKCKSNVMAAGISMFLFVVPAVLTVLEVPLVKSFSMNAFLDGNVILQAGHMAGIYLICGILLAWIMLKSKRR